jgi:hypothetical protein
VLYLGVEVLEFKNKCLLSKWLFKILNEEGVWQELIQNKYLHSKILAQMKYNAYGSPFFWKGLLKVKNMTFFGHGRFQVGNGLQTCSWEDSWLGNKPLSSNEKRF